MIFSPEGKRPIFMVIDILDSDWIRTQIHQKAWIPLRNWSIYLPQFAKDRLGDHNFFLSSAGENLTEGGQEPEVPSRKDDPEVRLRKDDLEVRLRGGDDLHHVAALPAENDPEVQLNDDPVVRRKEDRGPEVLRKGDILDLLLDVPPSKKKGRCRYRLMQCCDLDPHPDPHQIKNQNPDMHPDPQKIKNQNPDPQQVGDKSFPDPLLTVLFK
jgi:hypothetical protein